MATACAPVATRSASAMPMTSPMTSSTPSPLRRVSLLTRSLVVIVLVIALDLGCSPGFEPASLVRGPRVIAVVADPPEAVPGQAVSFSPVVASPTGTLSEGGGATATWWRCPDSDSDALGDFWQCSVPAERRELGGGVPYVDTVPAEIFGPPPPPGEPFDPDAASSKLLGALLGYWRVMGTTVAAGDTSIESFKRVPVYLPVPLAQLDERLAAIDVRVDPSGAIVANTNPLLTAVLVHEGAIDGPTVEALEPGQTYFFRPIFDERQLEAFFSLKMDLAGLDLENPASFAALDIDELLTRFERQQRCEIPTFNWYVTAGRIRREITVDEGIIARVYDERGVACPAVEGDLRTAETEYTAPTGDDEEDPLPADGVVHGWVVLRDGRGGTATLSFDLPITR